MQKFFDSLVSYVVYASELDVDETDEFSTIIAEKFTLHAGETAMTLAEQLERRGYNRGIEQGEKQGGINAQNKNCDQYIAQ